MRTRLLAAGVTIIAGLAMTQPVAHADAGVYTWKGATPATPVTLNVVDVTPSGEFVDALTAEASRWNAAGIPVAMHVTAEPGGTCNADTTAAYRVPVCRGDALDHNYANTTYRKADTMHNIGAAITVATSTTGALTAGSRLRVLLGHELGHVLGLIHSSTSPAASIMWKEAVNLSRCDGTPSAQDYSDLRAMYGTTAPYAAPADHDACPGADNPVVEPAQAAPSPTAPSLPTPAAKPAPARRAAPRMIPATPPRPAPVAVVSSTPAPPAGVPGILSTRW